MRFHAVVTLPLLCAAAACGTNTAAPTAMASDTLLADAASTEGRPGAAPTRAAATLMTVDGKDVGTVTVLPADEGIRLAVQVKGMPAGEHGIHLHAVGKCEGPKFVSAGSHWNPAGKKHGLANPDGPHAGDIPNLTVGEDGTGIVNTTLSGGTVADLLDADGAALVVHAQRDDGTTDPSGDSGDRIACAVLKAS